jgi:hypothetical protein
MEFYIIAIILAACFGVYIIWDIINKKNQDFIWVEYSEKVGEIQQDFDSKMFISGAAPLKTYTVPTYNYDSIESSDNLKGTDKFANVGYENVVYSHDYLTYDPDWYEGFLKFGNNFNVCSNRIYCVTGERFRDWRTKKD